MATLTDKEIEGNILMLNLTPRKILGGLTPMEVFTDRSVALITWIQQTTTVELMQHPSTELFYRNI